MQLLQSNADGTITGISNTEVSIGKVDSEISATGSIQEVRIKGSVEMSANFNFIDVKSDIVRVEIPSIDKTVSVKAEANIGVGVTANAEISKNKVTVEAGISAGVGGKISGNVETTSLESSSLQDFEF
ncbi:hypothetical protein [uncultured Vagococcus sp.]|uniref:hypothetical protein n=1 Tax=uncultured Vagococcus sp. TaxID=189676 RepID=UPI0028D1C488|nr:hypothetical protein [uncultured Vagococcus sp.]